MPRVLIIDDDRLICTCLVQVAEALGHEARSALDGRKGSAVAHEFAPDLIMVDLLMPERAGLETIVALRKEIPVAKIIAMTGQPIIGDVSLLELARKFGADEVVEKPFTLAEISTVISKMLPHSESTNAPAAR